jgi:hypothetical protein
MMDSDEREIFFYLKGFKDQFISAHEICRRAGGRKRYYKEPEWAKPVLARMAERRILEMDPAGHYRIKPREIKAGISQRWVSPQIARILKSSGGDFTHVIKVDEEELESYYNRL